MEIRLNLRFSRNFNVLIKYVYDNKIIEYFVKNKKKNYDL